MILLNEKSGIQISAWFNFKFVKTMYRKKHKEKQQNVKLNIKYENGVFLGSNKNI